MEIKRITLPLSEAEFDRLRMAAFQSFRRPREHARYLILQAIGMLDSRQVGEHITNLATTIPVSATIHGVGEPVFPELRTILAEIEATELLPYVDAREAYGVQKYGQTLMTGDGRDTPTEIMNEVLDLLAYATKAMMADKHNPFIANALLASVDVAKMWLELIEDGTFDEQPPVTQDELDRAEVKAKEFKALFVEES